MNAWVASVWLLQFEDFTKKRSAWEMQRLQNLDSKRSDLFCIAKGLVCMRVGSPHPLCVRIISLARTMRAGQLTSNRERCRGLG